jgi:hypothetical protein
MYKFATARESEIDNLLGRIEHSSVEMWEAMTRNADDDTIHKIDENIIRNLYELSEKKSESTADKRKIVEFALSKIEGHIDFDTSILFYTNLIRKNLTT